uniref:Uncharacterized protein n=1 Tax=Mesocestoides corti TaxID=53468 RepID=A0A5K3EJP1_MESCO
MKKTGTIYKASLTNRMPEPQVISRSPESTTLAAWPIIYCFSFVSGSDWKAFLPQNTAN